MHNALLLTSIVVLIFGIGAPVGALLGSRKSTGLLGELTTEEQQARRAKINARVRPRAKIALAITTALFVVCVCLTIATA